MTLCYVYKLSIYSDRSMKLRALSKSQNWPARWLVILNVHSTFSLKPITALHTI